MDVRSAIDTRRSVREYLQESVDHATLQKLIDAASMAPSHMNIQPWHFHVVAGPKRDELVKILNRSTLMLADLFAEMDEVSVEKATRFFSDVGGAPVVIAVSAPDCGEDAYRRVVDALSCGCALQNLQLAAHAEGLATCVLSISFWVKEDIAKFLEIEGRDIVCCVIIGKPAGETDTPGRRADIVTWVGV